MAAKKKARRAASRPSERPRRPVDYGALSQIPSRITLLDVFPEFFKAEANAVLANLSPNQLNESIAHSAQRVQGLDDVIVSRVSFQYKATRGEDDDVASVGGTFVVIYSFKGAKGGAVDDPLLDLFAEVNGTYNAWPYIRELVANSAARLGLAGVVVPLWSRPSSLPPTGEADVIRKCAT